jgi:ATP-dependent DNA helicase RecQ
MRAFGVPYLYPIQRFVVSNTLEGRNQIVLLPTGAGKSLCFQLPALILDRPTLVIMPLLALMADQLRKLEAGGSPVAALRGGLSPRDKDDLFSRVTRGEVRILLATPEACLVPSTEKRLKACRFAHFVVDEAHCICEWGRTFRPSYRELGGLCARLGVPCVTAFTATASPEVLADVKAQLFAGAETRLVETSPDRPNISYSVHPTLSELHSLTTLVRSGPGPVLVFCRTRKGAERTARELARRVPDRSVRFYHAGLMPPERQQGEAWFLGSRDGVLCATSAYGLGVDKPDIRTVVHLQVPPSVEAYLQESGRAGRDGKPSSAILLACPDEEKHAERLSDAIARRRFDRMLGYAVMAGACRRNTLLSLIGQQAVACSGCDICDGTARSTPEGAEKIVEFVRRCRRRFTTVEAAAILAASPGPRSIRSFHGYLRGWGALSDWDAADLETAIGALAAAGRIRIIARGPWKERLAPA